MAIPYRIAEFKSTNIFVMAIFGPTAMANLIPANISGYKLTVAANPLAILVIQDSYKLIQACKYHTSPWKTAWYSAQTC